MPLSLSRLDTALTNCETLSGHVDRFPLWGADPRIGFTLQLTLPGRPWRYIATAPVTCGAACEVPDSRQDALLVPFEKHTPPPEVAEITCTPGAKRSTPGPQFENDARTPFQSTAPTVRASATFAGATRLALALLLPAAATHVTPWLMAFCTAASTPCPVGI